VVIPREAADPIRALVADYPVVAITGPRQSGKTTLARTLFADLGYLSLEDPDVRQRAIDDPRAFLADCGEGAVLDEVQRVPELFSYLQGAVDEDPRPGRFILTGSQQFGLLAGITQSLAGRVALVPLLPFTLRELESCGNTPADLRALLYGGLFPPIHDRGLDPHVWCANYVQTYLERDVRQMLNVRDLRAFQLFLRMCAARCGQLVNLSALASDCGITHNTAKAWLSVLEASYVVHLLPPHHANFSKRLVKTPKLYFHDPALVSWLLGIRSPAELATHSMRGPLFETWVVSELLKARFNRGLTSNLFFWRDRAGLEIDVLVDRGVELVPVEIKSGRTLASDSFGGLARWRELAGDRAGAGWLVHGGDEEHSRDGCRALPWRGIDRLAADVLAR